MDSWQSATMIENSDHLGLFDHLGPHYDFPKAEALSKITVNVNDAECVVKGWLHI